MLIGSRPAAPDIPGTVTTRSEATYLEILPAGATKGAALRALAAAEGVPWRRWPPSVTTPTTST
ncbi:hypothetical protein ACI2LC_36625 [Nonomuraea wenchangensis]|uniref:hypothetical protein n=1 Tax=Nonomuraea wenchangensis TaxID=568860 RepID=UPI00385128B5